MSHNPHSKESPVNASPSPAVKASMRLLTSPDDARLWRTDLGLSSLALVPTMGALHEGHASLIRMARAHADAVVVSIFVNPMQFGPREDFARYPRPLQTDLALCEALGVAAVFAPDPDAMYPRGMDACTRVTPPETLVNRLCGQSRPGHFTGVATVVLKLFTILAPQVAVFGEKDAQQFAVLAHMTRDLNLAVQLLRHPVVREPDGLAMSSRNQYLASPAERAAALSLSGVLSALDRLMTEAGGAIAAGPAFETALERESRAGFTLEYLEAVDDETFAPVDMLRPGVRALIAGRVGDVRLIDTLRLGDGFSVSTSGSDCPQTSG